MGSALLLVKWMRFVSHSKLKKRKIYIHNDMTEICNAFWISMGRKCAFLCRVGSHLCVAGSLLFIWERNNVDVTWFVSFSCRIFISVVVEIINPQTMLFCFHEHEHVYGWLLFGIWWMCVLFLFLFLFSKELFRCNGFGPAKKKIFFFRGSMKSLKR